MNTAFIFAIALCVSTGPALAQSLAQNPVGLALNVEENTLVYGAPPGGLKNQAQPKGIVGNSSAGLSYFPLTATEDGGYNISNPQFEGMGDLTVSGYRDVLQGNQTVRWLQVTPTDQTGWNGWITIGEGSANQLVQQ